MFISEISLSGIGIFPETEKIISFDHNTLLCGNINERRSFLRALNLLFNKEKPVADDFYDRNIRISAKLTFPENDHSEIPEFFHHMRADENKNICAILEFSAIKKDDEITFELNWLLPHNIKRSVKPQELSGINFFYLADDENFLKNAIRSIMLQIFCNVPENISDLPEAFDDATLQGTAKIILSTLRNGNPATFSAENYISWLFSGIEMVIKENKKSFLQKLLHNLLLLRHNTLQMKSATGVNLFFIEELPGFNISLPGIQLIHSISLPRNIKELSLENIRCFSENPDKSIILPKNEADRKFLENAVKLFPELITSRLVVFSVSADDKIILEKFALLSGIDLSEYNISIIPLSGNNLHLLWQFLDQLGIPYLTLSDLNHNLPGGDWEKIAEILDCGCRCGKILPAADEENTPVNIELIRRNTPDLKSEKPWINYLEENWNVFFFAPFNLPEEIFNSFKTELQMLFPEYSGEGEQFSNHISAQRNHCQIYTRLFSILDEDTLPAHTPEKILFIIEKIKESAGIK
ncbi:MAG: hypothetical protein J6W00_15390 [Lentisphaeria bacterium]|nr:hypothetical protein [Lentisphaeria bacterium]